MKIISRNFQERPVLDTHTLLVVVETARANLGVAAGMVGFAFVDDTRMIEHHGNFVGKYSTTDVLSFPNELESVGGGSDGKPVEPVADPPYWGDVIICADEAARQARRLGHPYRFELMVLALHGVLHLLGFDHTRDQGEMRRLEEALWSRCASAGELS